MHTNIKKYFFSGLVVFLPLALTIFLFIWTLNFADGILGRYIKPVFLREFGFYFKGLSLLITISLVFIIGFFVTNYLGRRLHAYFEQLIFKLPFVRPVYGSLKEIALFIFSKERPNFRSVVLVEYPRKGIYSMGFLTNEQNEIATGILNKKVCNVFIPTTPSPLTGLVVLVPIEEVVMTDISIEASMKFIVSGGVLNPKEPTPGALENNGVKRQK